LRRTNLHLHSIPTRFYLESPPPIFLTALLPLPVDLLQKQCVINSESCLISPLRYGNPSYCAETSAKRCPRPSRALDLRSDFRAVWPRGSLKEPGLVWPYLGPNGPPGWGHPSPLLPIAITPIYYHRHFCCVAIQGIVELQRAIIVELIPNF